MLELFILIEIYFQGWEYFEMSGGGGRDRDAYTDYYSRLGQKIGRTAPSRLLIQTTTSGRPDDSHLARL